MSYIPKATLLLKHALLLFTFLATTIFTYAQSLEIEKLHKQINGHPQQDTFRVNRLNELATSTDFSSSEREKFANEALSISQKINYPKGEGLAEALLGSVKYNEGKLEESMKWLMQADSIAKKTGDAELQANVFFRMAFPTKSEEEQLILLKKADSIAKKTGNLDLQYRILSTLSIVSGTAGEKGLSTLLEAEAIAKKSGNISLWFRSQRVIGQYYEISLSDYPKAIEYYFNCLSLAEKAKDDRLLLISWSDIGTVYAELGDQNSALQYFLKAEAVSAKIKDKPAEYKTATDTAAEANLQQSIAESYRLSGKYPEAISAYNKTITLRTNDYTDLSNLADVYTRMDSLSLAFQYAFTALQKAKEYNNKLVESWTDGILSRAYLKKGMPDSAIAYGEWGFALARQIGSIEMMRDNTLALADAYAFKKDFKKAYDNRLLYTSYRDSMMGAEVRNKTAVQQYRFNLDKKEAEIALLSQQKKAQNNFLIAVSASLFLIVVTAIILLRSNRQKRIANKLLQLQKQEIDNKANELAQQKANLELLEEIGRNITSSLSVENIISTAYNNVNALMDANVFGIGIYNDTLKRIDFPATYEEGKPLPFYSNSIYDNNRFAPVCLNTGKEIIMGDLGQEYKDYVQSIQTPHEGEQPLSLIFIPLVAKEKKLGVLTVQSFHKNAYTDYHLYMLRNIAIYTAIALENASSYQELKSAQAQLIHSEKMASLGELTAGIAHEIQNPLNFVNNFSDVNAELISELVDEVDKGNYDEVKTIANNIKENEEKINHHGKRADAIVKGMLQHSRSTSGQREPTNINALCDEYLRLAYHGLRAKDKSFNTKFETDFDSGLPKINIVPQEIGRVILNLINNAFYAVTEKKKKLNGMYDPTVTVSTKKLNDKIEIKIGDNGNGIPQNIFDKIFQPFFTTKPTGQGTGLGLSLSYDIIKTHGGEIKVETEENKGTVFSIRLPVV